MNPDRDQCKLTGQRDKFLRDLLEVSAGARMGDQDAAIPDEEYVAAQRAERVSYIPRHWLKTESLKLTA